MHEVDEHELSPASGSVYEPYLISHKRACKKEDTGEQFQTCLKVTM